MRRQHEVCNIMLHSKTVAQTTTACSQQNFCQLKQTNKQTDETKRQKDRQRKTQLSTFNRTSSEFRKSSACRCWQLLKAPFVCLSISPYLSLSISLSLSLFLFECVFVCENVLIYKYLTCRFVKPWVMCEFVALKQAICSFHFILNK